MEFKNRTQTGCKDVFHAFLVEKAEYAGYEEMICTPKVRHFWRCIFLWQKRDKNRKSIVRNSKLVL